MLDLFELLFISQYCSVYLSKSFFCCLLRKIAKAKAWDFFNLNDCQNFLNFRAMCNHCSTLQLRNIRNLAYNTEKSLKFYCLASVQYLVTFFWMNCFFFVSSFNYFCCWVWHCSLFLVKNQQNYIFRLFETFFRFFFSIQKQQKNNGNFPLL